MANLTLIAPQTSFPSLLNMTSPSSGLTTSLQVVQDGLGNNSPISLSTLSFKINTSMGHFYIDNDPLLSTALQIDSVCLGSSFLDFTTSLDLPVGTTGQRPTFPENGTIRYNSTIAGFEGYNGAWAQFTMGPAAGYGPGSPTYITDTWNTTRNLSIGHNNFSVVGSLAVDCVAVGLNVLSSIITGADLNTGIGSQCLSSLTAGYGNTGCGQGALLAATTTAENAAFGYLSLGQLTTVNHAPSVNTYGNTGCGSYSGYGLLSGALNSFFGYEAGGNDLFTSTDFNHCTFIGAFSGSSSANSLDNATCIGYGSFASISNCIILGNSSVVGVGIGTTSPANNLHVIGSTQFQGIKIGYTGSGLIRNQYGVSTTGAGTNTIDFPVIASIDNQMVTKITISVMESTGLKAAYATSIAAAFWNGTTTASSGTLPTITFTGSAAFAVAAAWSISGNNLRLTVTGIGGTNAVWVITSEVYSSRATTG